MAPAKLNIGVLVVSDARHAAMKKGQDIDVSGKVAEGQARKFNHETSRVIVPDDAPMIKAALKKLMNGGADAVIIAGGTGVARRDVTIETVEPMFDKTLPGFGEMLRRIGHEKVGTAALLTRTTAGVIKGVPVFCLPGAPNAVKIAMSLILPEIGHVVKHARE
jgi:molybdenum cofactor biosynthesis protein B